jgi:hypothetical protein
MPLRVEERAHGFIDLTMLTAVVCLALGTWTFLVDATGVAAWKPAIAVGVSVLLALAALTRRPRWAAALRLLTGTWILAAPYLLAFAMTGPAERVYLTVGVLVCMLAMPEFAALYGRWVRPAI